MTLQENRTFTSATVLSVGREIGRNTPSRAHVTFASFTRRFRNRMSEPIFFRFPYVYVRVFLYFFFLYFFPAHDSKRTRELFIEKRKKKLPLVCVYSYRDHVLAEVERCWVATSCSAPVRFSHVRHASNQDRCISVMIRIPRPSISIVIFLKSLFSFFIFNKASAWRHANRIQRCVNV